MCGMSYRIPGSVLGTVFLGTKRNGKSRPSSAKWGKGSSVGCLTQKPGLRNSWEPGGGSLCLCCEREGYCSFQLERESASVRFVLRCRFLGLGPDGKHSFTVRPSTPLRTFRHKITPDRFVEYLLSARLGSGESHTEPHLTLHTACK